ncbi:MAG: hypothetical protein ACRDD1_15120, partial [Planctomycetia bacterium]
MRASRLHEPSRRHGYCFVQARRLYHNTEARPSLVRRPTAGYNRWIAAQRPPILPRSAKQRPIFAEGSKFMAIERKLNTNTAFMKSALE